MGILIPKAELMLRLGDITPLSGCVMQLGRQDVFLKKSELNEILKKRGLDVLETSDEYMSDVEFFKILGFDDVYSIDVSDYEDPSHVFDLSSEHIPAELLGIADFCFDGGTMEHVFNPINFLSNVHLLLKNNGFVVHHNPVNGLVNHGYYQFGPCFYYDYYKLNGYKIIMNYIITTTKTSHWRRGPWRITDLGSGWGQNDYLSFDNITTFFVAQKVSGSTSRKIPRLQTMYQLMIPGRIEAKKSYSDGIKTRVKAVIERSG